MTNVVITGSTKGIGFGLAKEFASRGHNVMITGRSQSSLDDAFTKLGNVSGNVVGHICEVAEKSQVQAVWDHAVEQFGSVDIWVNNAGLALTTKRILDYTESEVQSMVHTNMRGTINGCQVAGLGMEAAGGGKIFNMLGGGSDGSIREGFGIYGSTKRGLDFLTKALVKELKDSQIIIGGIRPGIIITEAVIREAHESPEIFAGQRKALNILADHVSTVAPYLVDGILNTSKPGTEIAWLTGSKIGLRFMLAPFKKSEDKFAAYGL